MKTYIALLRGINVGGHKKILMFDLRSHMETAGFTKVQTYIQSGNIVFQASERAGISEKISEMIQDEYQFEVPVIVKTASEIASILSHCPFSEDKKEKSYFILVKENPSEENIKEANILSSPEEEFYITDHCVYIHYAKGAGDAKLGINFFEKKLKVKATARNYRTMVKLLALAKVH
jgi:uncharacterized protein (DUF1697 family)